MTFTDYDLKRLKDLIDNKSMWPVQLNSPELLLALLARLEAAERFSDVAVKHFPMLRTGLPYQDWRKACGK